MRTRNLSTWLPVGGEIEIVGCQATVMTPPVRLRGSPPRVQTRTFWKRISLYQNPFFLKTPAYDEEICLLLAKIWQILASNDWAFCHLGTHCGKICPPASVVQSLGGGPPDPLTAPGLCPAHLLARVWEALSCCHVIWAAFISQARRSSCWGQQLALHGFREGVGSMASNMKCKKQLLIVEIFFVVCGFVFFVFNAFEGILFSLSETIPPKWLSLAQAGKLLLNSLKQ